MNAPAAAARGGDAGSVQAPPLATLYVVSALAGAATGLFNPLTSALLTGHGLGAVQVGVASSVFFLFVFLGAGGVRRPLQRLGARACIVAGILMTAAAAVLLPLASTLPGWLGARALMGAGTGFYLTGGQTALGHLAPAARRSVVSALNGLAFGIGLGLGPLLGTALYAIAPALAFHAGAALLMAGVPLAIWRLPRLRLQAAPLRLGLLRRLALPLHAVFAFGVAEATLLTLYPVFLLQSSRNVADIGVAFGGFVGGGLLSALPLSILSDRIGRAKVLLGCALVGAVASAALVFAHGLPSVVGLTVLTGASLGPVYAIALALMAQRVSVADLGAGTALVTAASSIGAMVAPWLSALVMQRWGAEHVFTLTAVLFGTLALRLLRSPVALVGVGDGDEDRT